SACHRERASRCRRPGSPRKKLASSIGALGYSPSASIGIGPRSFYSRAAQYRERRDFPDGLFRNSAHFLSGLGGGFSSPSRTSFLPLSWSSTAFLFLACVSFPPPLARKDATSTPLRAPVARSFPARPR